jgi:DNA recombination protein RmuC
VDAVIRLGGKLVPVDSKFPLENFRKMVEVKAEEERRPLRKRFITDVKKHIDAIASKYILPDEGTYDFALMYIPAENVYYECIIKEDETREEAPLTEYSLKRRVIPVSPGCFYAYLQAILLGLKGFQIEENARLIMQNLARLQGDFQRFVGDFEVMGKHLMNAKGKYDESEKRLERFQDKLASIAEDKSPIRLEVAAPAELPPAENGK